MALLAGGLLMALALYLAAIYAIVWSASRRISAADGRGLSVGEKPTFPSMREVWVRHSLEWLIGFFAFFLLLGITDFPIWQRLGLGAALALVFGSVWFDQSGRAPASEAGRRLPSNAWYWLLAVVDWLGFMWTLCFASALVVEVF